MAQVLHHWNWLLGTVEFLRLFSNGQNLIVGDVVDKAYGFSDIISLWAANSTKEKFGENGGHSGRMGWAERAFTCGYSETHWRAKHSESSMRGRRLPCQQVLLIFWMEIDGRNILCIEILLQRWKTNCNFLYYRGISATFEYYKGTECI